MTDEYKIEWTPKEKKRLETVKRKRETLSELSSKSHKELRQAILHPWCNRCKHIINLQCNCTMYYDENKAPSGFEPKEMA